MFSNKLRPKFHFSCPKGWMNDPNGFSFYGGQYHLFFQHYPDDTKWGPMHWGHAVSKDLLTFKNLKIALFPDSPFDNEGCFSGTSLTADQKHVLFYTGVTKSDSQNIQQQCIAFGNGKTYLKSEKNPVIKSSGIPFNFCKTDFRDPKIFKDNDFYFCAAVIKKTDGNGAIVLFKSKDLLNWNFVKIAAETNGELGGMWECPDLFSLENREVIILSPQQVREDKEKGFKQGNNCVYIIDSIPYPLDYGLDFYAAQTMQTPDGRRLMIAWMQAWDNNIYPENFKWCGQMAMPRELFFKNNTLCQRPLKEYENKILKLKTVSGTVTNEFLQNNLTCFDLSLNFSITPDAIIKPSDESFTIEIYDDINNFISFTFNAQKMKLTFDRSHSLKSGGNPNTHSVSLKPLSSSNISLQGINYFSIRFIFDVYSSEVFINNGEKTFTNIFFLNKKNRRLKITSSLTCGLQFKIIKL